MVWFDLPCPFFQRLSMSHPPAQKMVSKKHKARLQKEEQKRKILLLVSAVIFALIVIILLYGIFDQTFFKMRKPVAKVNDVTISSEDFIKMVKLERQQMNAQAYQYESYKQFFSFDEQNTQYFDSLIQQIQSQMAIPESVGATVIQKMIDQQIIKFYAEENGITVSDEEIQESLQRDFGFFPNGTPTPVNTIAPVPTSTLNPTQLALVPATPTLDPALENNDEGTDSSTEESETVDSNEVEIEPSATATTLPTPTVYTEELYQENYQNFLTDFKEIGFSENDIKELYRVQILSTKIYEEITADVPTEEEQIWARHILVATLEEAESVLERLEDGEDWTQITAEVSTDTSNKDKGGDLGWFGPNRMVEEFENIAFSLEIGEISNPVETSFGFHIIQLLGKEMRPLDSSTLDQNKSTFFSEWLTTEKEKYTVEQYDDVWTAIVPDTPAFGEQ